MFSPACGMKAKKKGHWWSRHENVQRCVVILNHIKHCLKGKIGGA